jgi:hypothetical protein
MENNCSFNGKNYRKIYSTGLPKNNRRGFYLQSRIYDAYELNSQIKGSKFITAFLFPRLFATISSGQNEAQIYLCIWLKVY